MTNKTGRKIIGWRPRTTAPTAPAVRPAPKPDDAEARQMAEWLKEVKDTQSGAPASPWPKEKAPGLLDGLDYGKNPDAFTDELRSRITHMLAE